MKDREAKFFQWAYAGVVCLAQILLQEANEQLADENDWPAHQKWDELNGSSRSIFLRKARKILGIPDDEFLLIVRSSDVEIDDIYNTDFSERDDEEERSEIDFIGDV
jgi:hypothetical protein